MTSFNLFLTIISISQTGVILNIMEWLLKIDVSHSDTVSLGPRFNPIPTWLLGPSGDRKHWFSTSVTYLIIWGQSKCQCSVLLPRPIHTDSLGLGLWNIEVKIPIYCRCDYSYWWEMDYTVMWKALCKWSLDFWELERQLHKGRKRQCLITSVPSVPSTMTLTYIVDVQKLFIEWVHSSCCWNCNCLQILSSFWWNEF